jgi:hypothetical protein
VLAPISPALGNNTDCRRSHLNEAKAKGYCSPRTLSIPVVQIVKPRNGLGHVSTKLGSRTSGSSDVHSEGGGVRRACVLVSSGLAGRSFTPGTYKYIIRSRKLIWFLVHTFFDLFRRFIRCVRGSAQVVNASTDALDRAWGCRE